MALTEVAGYGTPPEVQPAAYGTPPEVQPAAYGTLPKYNRLATPRYTSINKQGMRNR
jgi:hypothetical protein